MACALLVSGVSAQGASAVTGTTAFTCVKVEKGTGAFNESHCKEASGNKEYKHVAIAENTTTSLRGNAFGAMKLKATVGGVPITTTANSVELTGWMENKVDPGTGEHYIHGEGALIFKEVTVTGAGKECFVYEDNGGEVGTKGVVGTNMLTATSKGQGDALKLTPAVGVAFRTSWITDAAKSKANCVAGGTYTLSGSVTGVPTGATITLSHTETTTQNTLSLGGFKAGMEGTGSLEAEDPNDPSDSWTPLSSTTVTT
jgi:hypothetical protein